MEKNRFIHKLCIHRKELYICYICILNLVSPSYNLATKYHIHIKILIAFLHYHKYRYSKSQLHIIFQMRFVIKRLKYLLKLNTIINCSSNIFCGNYTSLLTKKKTYHLILKNLQITSRTYQKFSLSTKCVLAFRIKSLTKHFRLSQIITSAALHNTPGAISSGCNFTLASEATFRINEHSKPQLFLLKTLFLLSSNSGTSSAN